MSDTACISIEDVRFRYGDIPALNGVSLEINQGAFVAVVGQNGSGKTTLVKHLNGLHKPDTGRVIVMGQDTRHATVAQLGHHVGFCFQNPDHQIFSETTRKELAFGPINLGLPPQQVDERVAEALQLFGLSDYAEVPPAVLGYGLRRLVSVAAVYAMRPRVLVLDEPTAELDWRSAHELMDRIKALQHEGHTIVLVTHDMSLAADYADQVVVMAKGQVARTGTPRQVLADAQALQPLQLAPPQVTQLSQRLADLGMARDIVTVDGFVAAYLHHFRERG